MSTYSYSKIESFKQCPLRYKFMYIDKIEKDFYNTIEGVLGNAVHYALEMLYKELKIGKLLSLKKVLEIYEQEWDKLMKNDIRVIKDAEPKHYFELGKKYLENYYNKHKNFDEDVTIGLEQLAELEIFDENNVYKIRGYIDRLAIDKEGRYIIHDYKTGAYLPKKEDIENNLQLAIYALYVKKNYCDAENIILKWHYLAFSKTISIDANSKKLENTEKELIKIIREIENSKNYEAKESILCDWCSYASKCPKRAHIVKTKQMSFKDFSKDKGVSLVDEIYRLKKEKEKISEKIKNLEKEIIKFAEINKYDNIEGSLARVKIKKEDKIYLPSTKSTYYKDLLEIIKRSDDRFLFISPYYINKYFKELPEKAKAIILSKGRIEKKESLELIEKTG